jgi:hypothetical protein
MKPLEKYLDMKEKWELIFMNCERDLAIKKKKLSEIHWIMRDRLENCFILR